MSCHVAVPVTLVAFNGREIVARTLYDHDLNDHGRDEKAFVCTWFHRLKKLTESIKDVDLLDVQMKNLRQWLDETEKRLKSSVELQTNDGEELQRHFKELKVIH